MSSRSQSNANYMLTFIDHMQASIDLAPFNSALEESANSKMSYKTSKLQINVVQS